MKLTILSNVATLGLLVLGRGYADTVTVYTKTGHTSVNGHLVKMADGTITLEAVYSSGTVTRMIQLSTVESIEFNSTTFNSGPPSKAPGVGPGDGSAAPKQDVPADALELRGGEGERRPCKVVSIDENTIHCAPASDAKEKGKAAEYSRRSVLRIVVGGGR